MCYFPKHPYMIMKNFAAYIVWVLKKDVMIVIMVTRNFKNSWVVDLVVSMKRIQFGKIIILL